MMLSLWVAIYILSWVLIGMYGWYWKKKEG